MSKFLKLDNNGDMIPDYVEDYSTSELQIGTWIDGKPLYRKVKDIGFLPNTSTKTVSLDLSVDDVPVKLEGYFSGNNLLACLPFASTNSQYAVDFFYENGYVSVTTYMNRSSFYGRSIIYYIKTTD